MESIEMYLIEMEQMVRSISLPNLQKVLSLLENAYRNGHRIFIMGNGGSAATASHLALDLAKNTIMPGALRLKAVSLTDHVPLITAWSNDTAYEHVFAEQLANMIEPGDVVIGISTSGNSQNVINALNLAKTSQASTIGLLGAKGGRIKEIVDAYVLAPGQNIEQEEDAHMILAHVISRHMRDVVRSHSRTLALADLGDRSPLKGTRLMKGETRALRVLMVTPRYFPYMGGLETHVHEAGRRLVESGVNVTLLTTVLHTSPTLLPKEEVVDGMRVIRVRAWPPERDYYIAPEIYSIIERGEWDLVHCQGCHTFVPPLAMLAAKKARIPYVVTFHTGGHSSRFRSRIRGIQWKLLRPLLVNASKLIGVSNFEADYFRNLLGLPAKLFAVIPPPSTLPGLTQLPARTSTQSLIVSVGRLERYKGHQRLITALPKIREQRPDTQLLILGAGPYEATLSELARKVGVAEHVEIRAIPGSDRQAMVEFLSQASLVALLSEYEAHPAAVEEALALQRPVLVANTSGMRELAEQGFARTVPLNSTPGEIAAAVLYQIEQPLIPAQHTLPTWEDCTQKLLTIYNMSVRREQCAS